MAKLELFKGLVVGISTFYEFIKCSKFKNYWFPKPFWQPQSGHCHVIPLHDIPQKFSSMQYWHMANPHLHLQQKGAALLQQQQLLSFALRRFSLYAILPENTAIFNHWDLCITPEFSVFESYYRSRAMSTDFGAGNYKKRFEALRRKCMRIFDHEDFWRTFDLF